MKSKTSVAAIDFIRNQHGEEFPGLLALWEKQAGTTRFYANNQYDKLEVDIERLSQSKDLYVALGTQKKRLPSNKRGSVNTVVAVPGFFADIDFASAKDSTKNYPTDAEEALAILKTFPLEPTAIVHTGNGLHVHWDLAEPLVLETKKQVGQAIETWKAFQHRLIEHFQENGREIDYVGDLARVRRIPGTLNHKTKPPKPVELLEYHLDRRHDLETIEALLATPNDDESSKDAKAQKPRRLADHNRIVEDCAWYRNVVVEGAETCPEPDWYAGASMTSRCIDGEKIFHEYSRKHPRYNEREASQKFTRGIDEAGPRTCDSIAKDLGHAGCSECQHWGEITSPIQLGHRYTPGKRGPVPLGYTKSQLYALLDQDRNLVIQASSGQLFAHQTLLGYAPLRFWKRQFPAEKKLFNVTGAGEALIEACKDAGPFDPLKTRGRGVWRERDQIIVNLGGPIPVGAKHLYLCFEPISLEATTAFDANRLLDFLKLFKWRDVNDATLVLGWLAIAPICGVLNWRPHCFLYGPPKCGKTTIHSVAASLLEPLAISVDGQSSEAGIRQMIGPDSLPICQSALNFDP